VRFKRLTLGDYIINRLGKENVPIVRQYITSKNEVLGIRCDDITELSYQDLKVNVPALMELDNYEEIILRVLKTREKNVTLRKIFKVNVQDRLRFIFWVQEQYIKINELEERMLSQSPSPEQINAGVNTLNVLGDVNLIDVIAGGDILKWESIRQLPYGRIFEKQLRGVLLDRITERLETNRKNKRK